MRAARILVVDNEPGMLRAVERVLSDGHHVIGTRLAREALAVADEFRPELAILDIRMPDFDGFELMAQLKVRLPALDVILMTGSIVDLDQKLVPAIRGAACCLFQKPFDRQVLRTLVEQYVELAGDVKTVVNPEAAGNEMAEARPSRKACFASRECGEPCVVCCRYTHVRRWAEIL